MDERRQRDVLEGIRQSVETLILEIGQLCTKLDAAGLGHRPIVATYRERVASLRANIAAFSRGDLAETLTELEDAKTQLDALAARR